jgi:hypothetical protein
LNGTNRMDLMTLDRVIQEPDAGVISDSMKAYPISTGPWQLYAVDSCKALKVSLRGRFDKSPVY